MKITSIIILSIIILWADSSDWDKDIINNSAFEKMKIKNRSKKKYNDKVYKYISGHYKVKNNNIELANIYLDDNFRNDNIKINIITEDLKVEGNKYRDSIDIKQNKYKNFVQNDEKGVSFFPKEDNQKEDTKYNELGNNIQAEDSRYHKVPNEDVSELETIDLRGKHKIRDVNVYIKDVDILVD